jgi:hypothetical protein
MSQNMSTTHTLRTGRTITFLNIREKDRTFKGRHFPGEVHQGRHVAVTLGESIRLFGSDNNHYVPDGAGRMVAGERRYDLTFKIGDICELDSFNIVYFGRVEAITERSVSVRGESFKKLKRFDLATFERRNYDFDLAKAKKRNDEWLD